VQTLGEELAQLTDKVQYLILKRQDPNWVYPLLPYINRKLLEPNNDFETATAIALREIAEDDGRSYASELYGRFDEVRDLWRLKILNFRAVIIRFAGLNNTSMTVQEQKIGELHERIETRLAALQSLQEQGKLGLESEVSLETMQEASMRWQPLKRGSWTGLPEALSPCNRPPARSAIPCGGLPVSLWASSFWSIS
jgi:hypothetical protein